MYLMFRSNMGLMENRGKERITLGKWKWVSFLPHDISSKQTIQIEASVEEGNLQRVVGSRKGLGPDNGV